MLKNTKKNKQNDSYVKYIQKSRSFYMHSSKKEGCIHISVMIQYLSVTDTCLYKKDTKIQMYFWRGHGFLKERQM